MKIKLIQSGGITGKKMTASVNSGLTQEEWDELIKASKKIASSRGIKDGEHYILENGEEGSKTVIDIDAVPDKYEPIFKKLFDKLKPEA